MVEGWLIVEVGYFEVSLGNHRSDESFCSSTLYAGKRRWQSFYWNRILSFPTNRIIAFVEQHSHGPLGRGMREL